MTPQELRTWTNFYYQNPDPARVVQAFTQHTAQDSFVGVPKVGWLDRKRHKIPTDIDPWNAGPWPTAAFYATLLCQHPEHTSDWATHITKLPASTTFALAMWLAHTPESKKTLQEWSQHQDTQRSYLASELLQRTPVFFGTLEIVGPVLLDVMWMTFFASGDLQWVIPILGQLSKLNEPEGTPPHALGSAALWSLTANAAEHLPLREYLLELRSQQKDDSGFAILLDTICAVQE